MGESRTELLQWLNDLLQLNYTKIEQCGTGAAYCQIFDSIYGMHPSHYYSPLPTLQIFKSWMWLIIIPLHVMSHDDYKFTTTDYPSIRLVRPRRAFSAHFDDMAPAGDVPLTRVKFTAKHEYEFLGNFKVLQNVFKQHKVDRVRILRP